MGRVTGGVGGKARGEGSRTGRAKVDCLRLIGWDAGGDGPTERVFPLGLLALGDAFVLGGGVGERPHLGLRGCVFAGVGGGGGAVQALGCEQGWGGLG